VNACSERSFEFDHGCRPHGRTGAAPNAARRLHDLRLLSQMQAFGSTVCAMVQYAAMAVEPGMANAVACVVADAPLQPRQATGAAYGTGQVLR